MSKQTTSTESPYSFSSVINFLNQNFGLLLIAASLFLAGFVFGMLYKDASGNSGKSVKNEPQVQGEENEPVILSKDEWKEVTSDYAGMIGDEKAKATIVEVTDYQCPYCARHYEQTHKQLVQNYVDTGKVKILYRDQALPFHSNANIAAQAARCAADQDGFKAMHDALFANQQEWSYKPQDDPTTQPQPLPREDTIAKFQQYANDAGLNGQQLADCVSNDTYKAAVEEDSKLMGSFGANGTPSFFIEGQLVVGAQPYEEFEKVLEAHL